MHHLRPGLLRLANRDIADFGFTLADVQDLTGSIAVGQSRAAVLDGAGATVTDPAWTLDASPIVLRLAYLNGQTLAGAQQALDALAEWMALGPMLLWQVTRPTQGLLVSLAGVQLASQKTLKSPYLTGVVRLTRETPYYRDLLPQRYVATGTGSANRLAIPTGTAPHHLHVMVIGGTNATITQRAWDGSIVRQSTLAHGTGVEVSLNSQTRKVVRYVGGDPFEDPKVLTFGHGFFTADPQYAYRPKARWQTLETSSGTLIVDSCRNWLA